MFLVIGNIKIKTLIKSFDMNFASLKSILRSLDHFVGDYPIYVFLIDAKSRLLWMNGYMKSKFQENGEFIAGEIWKDSELSIESLTDSNLQKGIARKSLIKRRFEPDQEEIYLECLSLPIQTRQGEIEGILNLGFDVTEAQRQQEELREKEKLFTAIINSSQDAIIFLDNDDRIVSWNKGAQSIFGYTEEEIIRKSILQLIPKELIELGELYFIRQELEKNKFIRKHETQRLTRDGRSIFVDLTRTLILDPNGNPIGSSEIIKDNTRKKELEFELLRTIVELSKLNELNEILYTTYDQNEIYRLILIAITAGEGLRFNRAFLVLLDENHEFLKGHLAVGPSNEDEAAIIWNSIKDQHGSLKDIVQRYRIDIWGKDHRVNEIVEKIQIPIKQTDHVLVKSAKSRKSYHVMNGTITNANRKETNLDMTSLLELLEYDNFVIVPLYTKKEPIGVIIADNRITRREISMEDIESLKLFAIQASLAIENTRLYKNLEDRINDLQEMNKQLQENQDKLVRAERFAAIGEMSATVAHEIRNPLVSIGGFANLIEKKISERSYVERYAKIISDQVSHLEFILTNLLNLAKPPLPEKESVNINRVIQEVITVMQTSLDQRNIRLTADLDCPDGQVIGDEKLLYQVFLNLLKNAIEAVVNNKGVREIQIATLWDENSAEIVFADNGPGMDPVIQDKIFNTFFTTKSGGTGLGLAIVKQIVQNHNGMITVESSPNEGTTFYLKLPRCRNS